MKNRLLFINYSQFGYSSNHFYFAKYLKSSFRIDFVCLDLDLERVIDPDINVIYVKHASRYFRLVLFLFTAIKLSFRKHYDSIFLLDMRFVLITGMMVRCSNKIIDIPTGDLHDNRFVRKVRNLFLLMEPLPFHKIITLNDKIKEELFLPEKKTFIVPQGAEIRDRTIKEYNYLNLLYIGTLNKRKIDETIKGIQLFLSKYKNSDIPLIYNIIGYGEKEVEKVVRELIVSSGLSSMVFFRGGIFKESELKPYFKNANIGVSFVPQTPYYTIQPATKLCEYALSGLINIATNTIANRIQISKDNGVICEDNAESFSLALEKVYKRLSSFDENKIRMSLENCHWEAIVNKSLLPVIN